MQPSNNQDSAPTDSQESAGEGPEEPPHAHAAAPNNSSTVPLPPPESGTYEKSPGHTYGSLKKLIEDQRPSITAPTMKPSNSKNPDQSPSVTSSKITVTSNGSTSPPSSPTFSGSEREWPSAPSTRPNSQAPSRAPSRAPSMSGGQSGGKIQPLTSASKTTPKPSTAQDSSVQRSVSSSSAAGGTRSHATDLTSSQSTVRPKPASLHSNDGDKHKFNLKDLLGSNAGRLARKSSQRSTGSSRKSDTESVDGDNDRKSGKGARSTAGDSATSLSQKYGVCQKLAIGKGATSVVRLAHKWDRSEEKLYAVKEFRKRRKNETEKDYVKKLTAEFCISSTLHHINIVETVDLVQDENHHWCEVMEFCPGGDLYAAIKKGGMSPSEVECCFKQILRGVEYLHSQGVAHRDIKPENLFFDTKGHLKIGDYGASTVYRLPWETTIHMSTGLCGSEPYIAPEQFLGKPYDARLVDIWACGIVYYCLHFSELPWRAAQSTDSLYGAYAAACSASPTTTTISSNSSSNPSSSASSTISSTSNNNSNYPPTISNLSPRACRSLLRRMLEPNPKERASIEEVVKHPWMKEIEICWEVDKAKHVHVNAMSMAKQMERVERDRD
ncbi:Pkinase-domain-containing protein [Marasmius fiardii PR-910]|nr:Pkinase-domain-containing protein [Marasmius fiardii PR-910]